MPFPLRIHGAYPLPMLLYNQTQPYKTVRLSIQQSTAPPWIKNLEIIAHHWFWLHYNQMMRKANYPRSGCGQGWGLEIDIHIGPNWIECALFAHSMDMKEKKICISMEWKIAQWKKVVIIAWQTDFLTSAMAAIACQFNNNKYVA